MLSHYQANKQVNIPKEHHRWILGKQGQRLKDLEKTTATKIQIPSVNDQSDVITIVGTKEGIEKAEHEIKVISDEQSRKAFERVNVPKMYHPFIYGPHNENLTAMIAETGARINIPPPSVQKDEITIAGEKEGVLAAKEKIETIFKDMVRDFRPLFTRYLVFNYFFKRFFRLRGAPRCPSRCQNRSTST